jgi:hypothetical protein
MMFNILNSVLPQLLWEAPAEGAPTPPPAADAPSASALSDAGTPPKPDDAPPSGDDAGGEDKSGDGADDPKGEDDAEDDSSGEAPEPLTAESFALPEGTEVSEEHMNTFVEVMNDADLSPAERGQKIIDLQTNLMEAATEQASNAAITAWDELQGTWQTELKALPEIGGDKLDASLASIKEGLERAGADEATFEALNQTGAGNNPHLVKLLYTLTRNSAEGGPVSGAPAAGKLSQADKMFGASKE